MFRNIHYDTKNSIMHVWSQDSDGKNHYNMYKWVPYVYVESPRGKDTTIDGKTVFKKNFQSYYEYYNYCKNNSCYENNVKPEIQYLAERYHDIEDEEMYVPNLCIYTIDIEVHFDQEFPNPNEAKYPIVLISVKNNLDGNIYSFGVKEYTGEMDVKFIYCEDEETLLRKFLGFMNKFSPDVITGWNIDQFDIPYIINRCKVLFEDDSYKRLSPINVVRTWEGKDKFKKKKMNVDIGGVSILDFFDLYKWYSRDKLESYTLDYVSHHELEKGKIDYSEYKDLRTLYYENWNLYVEYNAIDSQRVYELEEKLGYIKLVQSLSLITRVPMKLYHTQTALIEGVLLTHFRRNGLCAPYFAGGSQKSFEAAWVKEPQTGKHYWVVDLDIASSYPSHIITLNMSPETYYGRIIGMSEEDIINYTKTKSFPKFELLKNDKIVTVSRKKLDNFNLSLKKKILSVSPCGSLFNNTKIGVFSELERNLFAKRKKVKTKMIRNKDNKNNLDDEKEINKLDELIKQQNSKQLALKVLLNAVFGITAVPYSRYFNTNISEAITSCGRYTIKSGDRFCNDLMNDVENESSEMKEIVNQIGEFENKMNDKVDFISYTDTDSVGPDSIIETNIGRKTIEELWKFSVEKESIGKDKYLALLPGVKCKSFNIEKEKVEDKNIKYIMKHKVMKKIFRIKIDEKYVDVTEDHSIIVKRDGIYIPIRPYEIKKGDKIIIK